MVKKKRGFIAMSLIYTFFLLFVAILIYILGFYASNADNLNVKKASIKENLEAQDVRTWDQDCYASSLLLNCRLLFKDANAINPASVIAAKSDLNDPALFKNIEMTNNVGLHVTKDIDGNTYFYRGDVTNNYVQFGTANNEDELYWQIIRINGDGSIRLIYLGTSIASRGSINITDLKNIAVIDEAIDSTPPKIVESKFCITYNHQTDITLENIFDCNSYLSASPLEEYKKYIGNIGRNEAIALGASSEGIANTGFFLYSGNQYHTNDSNLCLNSSGQLAVGGAACPQERPVISISADSIITDFAQDGTQANPYIVNLSRPVTVTFNSNGGSAVASITTNINEIITQPADPIKNGYTFAGWFLAGTAFDFNDPITDDITLIAKWN